MAAIPDLLGLAETAETLGVERSRLSRWRQRGVVLSDGRRVAFPEPVLVVKATPLWRGREIRALRDRYRTR
jgi:hypothetical protein